MLRNKLLLATVLIAGILGTGQVYAKLTLEDMSFPKSPAYRVGISEIPETQYIEAKEERSVQKDTDIQANIAKTDETDLTYADLSIKRLSKEVSQDLVYEEQDMVSDLTLLWQGAAMQSDTINFALYKLANPDADKPDKNGVRKMLQSIASMSTLIGAGMANPLLAGTSFITGNVLGIMSQDTKALNYKYTKVTDADMIILIRKVEDLQQNAVNLYYDYMTAKNQLDMTTKLVNDRRKRFETAQKNNAPKELIVITDAYYRTALDKQRSARSEFFSKRAALEQFVGNETFTQFEQELDAREKGLNKDKKKDEISAQNEEYNKTISNVESFTNNLNNTNEKLAYAIDDYDNHLDMLPELRPMATDVSAPAVQSNIETVKSTAQAVQDTVENVKQSSKELKKSAKEAKKAAKISAKQKAKAEKENLKYNTKGLIFNHPKKTQEEALENSSTPVNTSQPTTATPKKTEKFNGVELLPLEEIKVPDLHKNGYSIFSEGAY